MSLVVTIFETSPEAAMAAIRSLPAEHDMIEVRVDGFAGRRFDLGDIRRATSRPIILTNRGGHPIDIESAVAAGINYVDVEYRPGLDVSPHQHRVVLSHHDYVSMPALDGLLDAMLPHRCAHTKIAVTPLTLRENELLLKSLRTLRGVALFGMGERGLYSRILAPFFGSTLTFVSVDASHLAGPGQLTLENALAIYGGRGRPAVRDPRHIFAVVGNPAGHSLSPSIHNPLFRKHNLSAAYTIASVDRFDEVIEPFTAGRIRGLSITAPFKDDALEFARKIGADIGDNAREANAVNTLVTIGGRVVADNTDVDGFEILLRDVESRRAAVVGAGGTGRAALVALRRRGVETTVYNRTAREGARPLEELPRFRGDLVINTLPGDVDIQLPKTETYIETAYRGARPAARGPRLINGQRLLEAQAIRQNELFVKACR
jgi:3-dehydroquinate dehydratase type I